MKVTIPKACFVVLVAVGVLATARILMINPLLPTSLVVWGCICFLFSRELSGARRRIKYGLEEKPALQIMWMIAGILCLLMGVGVLFTEM